jgi:glycerol-3-phosphate dehydrogenase (NAD(P)+)
MKKILIIGAGEIGKALGGIFEKNTGFLVEYWDKDSEKLSVKKEFSEVVSGVDFIFLCIPSWAVRDVLEKSLNFLKKDAVVTCLSKGIEKDSQKTMSEVLAELLPKGQNFALLGGPMIAEEIAEGKFSAGVVASEKEEVFEKIKPLFENSNTKVEYSKDVYGVALCGVLKNIYALLLGMADGLGSTDNRKGYLTAKAINEMAGIIEILGGKKETAFSVAGLGDLIATGFSECSHNWCTGCKIAKGEKDATSEGTNSLSVILEILKEKSNKFSILTTLDKIVNEKKDPIFIFDI